MSQVSAVVCKGISSLQPPLLLFSRALAEKKNRTTEEKGNWQPVRSQHADSVSPRLCALCSSRVLKTEHHNESERGNMVDERKHKSERLTRLHHCINLVSRKGSPKLQNTYFSCFSPDWCAAKQLFPVKSDGVFCSDEFEVKAFNFVVLIEKWQLNSSSYFSLSSENPQISLSTDFIGTIFHWRICSYEKRWRRGLTSLSSQKHVSLPLVECLRVQIFKIKGNFHIHLLKRVNVSLRTVHLKGWLT